MLPFGDATRAWFAQNFAAPTAVQRAGWPKIAAGEHSLLIAPTGSGKTLAAFLYCIDRLAHAKPRPPGVRTLYISPLKALVYDIERNLRAPLVGIGRAAELGHDTLTLPRVSVRTGDTTAKERRLQARDPGELLVTTPESLYLILGSQARETLRTVDTVIVDEVHALAPTKRGAHLALSLERLSRLCDADPQRIGLSATARPLDAVAKFLGGDRPVSIVDASAAPMVDLRIIVPVPDMTRPTEGMPAPASDASPTGESLEHSIWPAVYPRLLDLINGHASTIIFVNSRGLCERLAQRLNEQAGQELVRAHHGSISHHQRTQIEEMLKGGHIRAIVATSSLELGIDMGAVDLVVLVESPGAVHRGLQRVGRAGHGVGETSKGRIFPKHRGDLVEATVVARGMQHGAIEALRVPRNPLDVLAQQIVAMCGSEDWPLPRLQRTIRRAANFHELPDSAFVGVLDMLSGRYPSHAFADLRPRLDWDRDADVLSARRGSKMLSIISGGTIPDRGTYGMHLGEGGPRVGELDEEMVHETLPGQNIMLGATTWRVERITRDRVIVTPAPGEPGRLPFWRGDGPGRPIELGRAMGKFLREVDGREPEEAHAWLRDEWGLDEFAARNLVAYVGEQKQATECVPTDRAITIERFRDELGDWRICILTPMGARVHAPWALAIQTKLEAHFGFEVQALWSDDGIVLRLVEIEELPELSLLLPDPEEVEELVIEQLAHSALFAGQFRENAARSLLLPRRRAHERQPLWAQRLKSQQLLAVARDYPSFPIILETYRACLEDVFDLPALVELLGAIRRRDIRADVVETPTASPFARSLVFAYVATYLYEGDAPLAERKAQALALDRQLLRELLGHDELRELLDAGVIEQVEAELQGLAPDRHAQDAEQLRDRLRRIGDLSPAEAAARATEDPGPWIRTLTSERKVATVRLGGEPRILAIEDVASYRDAIGTLPPPGLPQAFLEPVDNALGQLVARYARTHGPFLARDIAARWSVPPGPVRDALTRLQDRGTVIHGEFRPGGSEREWCDAEVLRSIKRRTLAKLRGEIAPVDSLSLGRFLPAWHGIGDGRRGLARLEDAIAQLEGLALSYSELERVLLPARVADFSPRMLDELGAMGWLVWVGRGALGKNDGRVALYRRERVAQLLDAPTLPEDADPSPLHLAILGHLERRGACFFVELQQACGEQARVSEVREALWDLAWWGMVTNDTFSALRAFGTPSSGRVGRGNASLGGGGRWSRVADLIVGETSATTRAHARAVTLLQRHGLVTREAASIEHLPGGFSAVYPVLKAMEETGKVRRGYFVDGLGGAQFASPGAVDRIRATRAADGDGDVVILSAIDPANPYGWLIPWPTRDAAGGAGPRRVPGASVVLVDGQATLFIDRGGKRLVTFPAADEPRVLLQAARALAPLAARQRGRMLRIEKIDGDPARTSSFAEHLREADFASDLRGLTLEAR
jgi:ATP-dependent Lhr-like helicase